MRDKASDSNCITGFTHQTSGEIYHLTSIMDGKLRALSLNNDIITLEDFKMNDMPFKLEWTIRDGDCVSSLSSVNHTYGLSVMPSDRSVIRKSQLLENNMYLYKMIKERGRKQQKGRIRMKYTRGIKVKS